ncbi:Mitochondrial import inner membrane translocase subunit Tim54 [Amanita muscaria]
MSVHDTGKTPQNLSGIRSALRYTGIPTSWLDKRPKLPSRNWLIFLSVVSSVTGLYIYDRRQCKQIRQSYIDRVQSLSEEAAGPLAQPRKVTVYGAKWPGDEDYDQCMKYFRKYVKPILVAAAVDYESIVGKKHGDIANRVANDIRLRRRMDHGIDTDSDYTKALPTYKTLPERRKKELEGGIVIVGRPTFKEVMAGFKRGWTQGLEDVDHEEMLAQELESDPHFDEPEDGETLDEPVANRNPIYSPLRVPSFTDPSQNSQHHSIPEILNAPPTEIPLMPPILFVPFVDHIGLKQIPLMLWNFFNQRQYVKAGADAAYRLIMNASKPFDAQHDLHLGEDAEAYYKKSSLVDDINNARRKYYEELPAKLQIARALARGTREPTKEERENPPPTEVELRAERMNKERRWRSDLTGWSIVDPSSSPVWDDRLGDALRLFADHIDT